MKYILPCGREFEANTTCYAVGFRLSHNLKPESKDIIPVQTKISFFEDCQKCAKGTKLAAVRNFSTTTKTGASSVCPGKDIYCMGYSTEYLKYREMDIPSSYPAPYYGFPQSYTVEVTVQCDEYRAILYFHNKDSEDVSMLEYIDAFMEDDIMERYYGADEDTIQIPMIALDTGDFCAGIEFENFEKFKAAIINVRIINYSDHNA